MPSGGILARTGWKKTGEVRVREGFFFDNVEEYEEIQQFGAQYPGRFVVHSEVLRWTPRVKLWRRLALLVRDRIYKSVNAEEDGADTPSP